MVGLGLAAAALLVLLSRGDVWPVAGAGWIVVLLAGLALLWTYDSRKGDRRSRRIVTGLLTIVGLAFAAMVAAIVVGFAWFHVSLGDGVGDRVYTPATAADVRPSYSLGVGNLRVDLSNVQAAATVHAKVGVGELRITVPRNVTVAVDARATLGDVYVFDQRDDGHNASVKTGSGAALVIDAKVGAGRIDVVRDGA